MKYLCAPFLCVASLLTTARAYGKSMTYMATLDTKLSKHFPNFKVSLAANNVLVELAKKLAPGSMPSMSH